VESSRVAREEAVKREVNEAIEGGLWPDERQEAVRMRCECGSPDCIAHVNIPVPAYEKVRSHPRRFVIAVGHDNPQVERVIVTSGQYAVVEKLGLAGEVAEQLDPRDGTADEPAV
jgi:hypothetical protein